MDNSDTLEVQDAQLEQRLRAYYVSQFGGDARTLWEQVAEQLGEQDYSTLTPVDGSSSTTPNPIKLGVRVYPTPIELPKARQQIGTRGFSWTLAAAATIILALGGVMLTLLTLGKGTDLGSLFTSKEQVLFSEGFEKGLEGWGFTDNSPVQYANGTDTSTFHSGMASGYIEAVASAPDDLAWLSKNLDAKDYLDKRIRFSAYIKSDSEDMVANLSMFVSGQPMPAKGSNPSRVRVLGLDSMDDRLVRGQRDWQRYDIVLDVPANATGIYISLMAGGKGRVWFDDVQLSVADGNVPVTNVYRHTELTNADFEQGLSGWGVGSPRPQAFEVGTDTKVAYAGTSSGVISSTLGTGQQASLHLLQIVRTDNFKGKRIRFSAYVRTAAVEKRALLWLGIRDLAGADMGDTSWASDEVTGTSDWQQYQLVLDVPEDSFFFYASVGLEGSGKVWVDNVRFEVVDNDVPLTNAKP